MHEIFCCSILHWSNIYRQILRLSSVFDFVFEFTNLFKFFRHLAVTQLRGSLIPCQLSQLQVRLHINWINAEWDFTSTESTNDEIFVNVGAFCIDSVDIESHSTLTQLMWSLTPHWLSLGEVSLHVNSVCGRCIKPKQADITSSGAFKG